MRRTHRNMPADLTLDEALADPIVNLLMRSDGIGPDDVRATMRFARRGVIGGHGAPVDPLCRVSLLCDGILPIAGAVTAMIVLVALTVGWSGA